MLTVVREDLSVNCSARATENMCCADTDRKPILKASEIDDSRPTVVRVMSDEPKLVSVLSGKINTVYDLDEVLEV